MFEEGKERVLKHAHLQPIDCATIIAIMGGVDMKESLLNLTGTASLTQMKMAVVDVLQQVLSAELQRHRGLLKESNTEGRARYFEILHRIEEIQAAASVKEVADNVMDLRAYCKEELEGMSRKKNPFALTRGTDLLTNIQEVSVQMYEELYEIIPFISLNRPQVYTDFFQKKKNPYNLSPEQLTLEAKERTLNDWSRGGGNQYINGESSAQGYGESIEALKAFMEEKGIKNESMLEFLMNNANQDGVIKSIGSPTNKVTQEINAAVRKDYRCYYTDLKTITPEQLLNIASENENDLVKVASILGLPSRDIEDSLTELGLHGWDDFVLLKPTEAEEVLSEQYREPMFMNLSKLENEESHVHVKVLMTMSVSDGSGWLTESYPISMDMDMDIILSEETEAPEISNFEFSISKEALQYLEENQNERVSCTSSMINGQNVLVPHTLLELKNILEEIIHHPDAELEEEINRGMGYS